MHGRLPRALAANVQNPSTSHSVPEGLVVSALQFQVLAIRPERLVIAEALRQQLLKA